MKHVVTGAPGPWRVLVTGFGAFPGAPVNPTIAILRRLERAEPRLARLGIALATADIPVIYGEIDVVLAAAVARHRPDAILHLGLASGRRKISIETRAVNRAGPLHPDAAGRHAAGQRLLYGGRESLAATWPAVQVAAAIRHTGSPAGPSIDAGDYVCNATLYRSLVTRAATQIGFLHVPRVRRPATPSAQVRTPRPTIEAMAQAALAAILVMARRGRGAPAG